MFVDECCESDLKKKMYSRRIMYERADILYFIIKDAC